MGAETTTEAALNAAACGALLALWMPQILEGDNGEQEESILTSYVFKLTVVASRCSRADGVRLMRLCSGCKPTAARAMTASFCSPSALGSSRHERGASHVAVLLNTTLLNPEAETADL
ncbi:hypothetical protein EYF80_050337 [Liparis tanakae]|uniref:Uncharacterized protein n=1 Tax=Liparis tanakae TaxID=230148 RepID=A0A4Z2FE97_9TELE|nr:hypothetical protein EYF80_050337 [Liparis tanakae]